MSNQKEIDSNLIAEIINDLYLFYRCFITANFKNDVEAPHIEKLAYELSKMYLGEYKRLCVAMPPRHSKSSMVTLAYPLWLIFQNPNLNILVVNNTADLSEKFGIQLREHVKKYGELFGVYLSDVKHSSSYLMFENREGELCQGSIRLVGANGSITGQDADYIIIDDPYKGFEDTTSTLLEKKIHWFKTIVEQRIEPQTKLVILHTRWKNNDLQGYLKEHSPNKYKFLTFPAILDDGEPLWKEAYTREILESKREEMGEVLFNAIFQQQPIDNQSDFFAIENIKWRTPDVPIVNSIRSWDIASSEDDKGPKNDYTVGTPMYLLEDGCVLITDYVRGQFGKKTLQKIKRTTRTDGPGVPVIIETGVAAAGKLLFEEWQDQLEGYKVERSEAIGSKPDRATPFQNALTQGQVYVDIEDDTLRRKFINEFDEFPYGEHDDIVDSVAYGYNWLKHHESKSKKKPDLQYIDFRFG